MVDKGEFPNIKNNPLWQVRKFNPVNARYFKFQALGNLENNNTIGYAEIGIITSD